MNYPLKKTSISYTFFALLIFLLSCEKTEQPITFRVNQFKQTAIGVGPLMTLSIQQGNQIGTENWTPLYSQIVGFNYEPGYIYDLLVTETEILNPPADGSNKGYYLKQVLAKTKVNNDDQFSLTLKVDETVFVKGDANNGYNILEQVEIDCGNLCSEFYTAMQSNAENITGKFVLNENGSIKLVELDVD